MSLPDSIPRTLHLYWGRNGPLSFMRWMTVRSFVALNPGWSINVWTPERPSHVRGWTSGEHDGDEGAITQDWWPRISDIHGLSVIPITGQQRSDVSEIHRSDLFRWWVLADVGGVWSDFDILYLRPIEDVAVPPDADVVVSYFKVGRKRTFNQIGLLMAADNDAASELFDAVSARAARQCVPGDYQSAGSKAMDAFIPGQQSRLLAKVYNMPEATVYPYQPRRLPALYSASELRLPPETVGIHWFAGDAESQRAQSEVTIDNVDDRQGEFFRLMGTITRRDGVGCLR